MNYWTGLTGVWQMEHSNWWTSAGLIQSRDATLDWRHRNKNNYRREKRRKLERKAERETNRKTKRSPHRGLLFVSGRTKDAVPRQCGNSRACLDLISLFPILFKCHRAAQYVFTFNSGVGLHQLIASTGGFLHQCPDTNGHWINKQTQLVPYFQAPLIYSIYCQFHKWSWMLVQLFALN